MEAANNTAAWHQVTLHSTCEVTPCINSLIDALAPLGFGDRDLFGGAPALLLGIEDPLSNAHAPNESLHAGDFRKLTASLAHLFDLIGSLPNGKVK